MSKVDFPQFELIGPPCEDPACKGVLVDHISTRTQECFRRCATCKKEFGRMPAKEKLAWATRTIERALRGEKSS